MSSNGRNANAAKRNKRLIAIFLIVLVTFSTIYFPLSPINKYVQGGRLDGNQEFKTITTMTPDARFLNEIIQLIPSNASVLTQNSIPQLSGRENVQVPVAPSRYVPSIPYNYILIDTAITPEQYLGQVITIVNESLWNGSFGILAEGHGALLLERNYSGSPVIFIPNNLTLKANDFSILNNSEMVGNSVIKGIKTGFTMWYGPYVYLPPGSYSATFELSSANVSVSPKSIVTLDVVSGNTTYASSNISVNQFSSNMSIRYFTLNFSLQGYVGPMQFRGMNYISNASLSFYGVNITQKL